MVADFAEESGCDEKFKVADCNADERSKGIVTVAFARGEA